MPRPTGSSRRPPPAPEAAHYAHADADLPLRPEVGTQAQFKKHQPPQTYRYDSSLSPALDWDSQNPAREQAEAALAEIIRRLTQIDAEIQKPGLPPERKAELEKICVPLRQSADKLKSLAQPFLNWTGKAERLSFDVPTLPLFVHERLSTRAIIETLTGHQRDQNLDFLAGLFADPRHSLTDQVLHAYEYREGWVNRMVLGDSLVVMNSLLRYESLGGQVQMIYLDPPYGVKFGSNFQPFVRKRDVSHGDDADMTREPEMVQAYRDTWELGLHSYLTYLRDRLLLARELLAPSGSIFVQISDENLHHVREVMDEVFGAENFCSQIAFATTTGRGSKLLDSTYDTLLWYAKDIERAKFRKLFVPKGERESYFEYLETPDGKEVKLSPAQLEGKEPIPDGKRFLSDNLTSQGETEEGSKPYTYKGITYQCPAGRHWRVRNPEGLDKLAEMGRLFPYGRQLRAKTYLQDFPWTAVGNIWEDVLIGSFVSQKLYVVQTSVSVIERCVLMTTDPGDLVLDPTCGSGTTAYVAEQWGRRWITMDTSRVPLALARQRLLTATFPYYEINSSGSAPAPGALSRALAGQPGRGETSGDSATAARSVRKTGASSAAPGAGALPNNPADGFVYKRRQNSKGEEVGGIVPHITLRSIANNEPPAEEVLVDRPEEKRGITRVCGPFVVEATIPTAHGLNAGPDTAGLQRGPHGNFVARMLEVLRKSPVLRLDGNRTVTFKNIRPPAKTLVLSAEALVDKPSLANLADDAATQRSLERDTQPVAFLFGPENGAVSERLVAEAAREAWGKNYSRLYVIGFAIEAKARETIENCEAVFNVPATYVQATPDLLMGDLLKNMRSSQIFSVCGSPEIKVRPVAADVSRRTSIDQRALTSAATQYQVELLGLDVFDPVTMEVTHRAGSDVPAWFLDTDYNGRVFHVTQAFFPRTGAWESLKRALKGDYDETVWDHLAGTVSAPFAAGEHRQIAVKVIDDRGNELLVVKKLEVGR